MIKILAELDLALLDVIEKHINSVKVFFQMIERRLMLKKGEVKMIHKMLKEGMNKSAMARNLDIARDTVIKYPEAIRKHIYTTNSVESVHSSFEKMRIKKGGFFQSMDILNVAIFIVSDKLNLTWKKPNTLQMKNFCLYLLSVLS